MVQNDVNGLEASCHGLDSIDILIDPGFTSCDLVLSKIGRKLENIVVDISQASYFLNIFIIMSTERKIGRIHSLQYIAGTFAR